jgi:hypothetical protein
MLMMIDDDMTEQIMWRTCWLVVVRVRACMSACEIVTAGELRYKLIAQFSDAQVDLVDSVETGLDH